MLILFSTIDVLLLLATTLKNYKKKQINKLYSWNIQSNQ